MLAVRSAAFLLLIVLAAGLTGCGGQQENIVFEVEHVDTLDDGRPVVEVKKNGQPLPDGMEPTGAYLLLVRKNGDSHYTRMFYAEDLKPTVRRDLAIPAATADDELTVAVELPLSGRDVSKGTIRLSNSVSVPAPGADAPNLAVPPIE